MTALLESLRSAASAGGLLAVPLAFLGGVLTGLNPCCVPLYPAAAATCCAGRREMSVGPFRNPAAFVGGVATATALLGVLAALAGRAFSGLGGWVSYLAALVPILMGIHLIGLVRIPMPRRRILTHAGLAGSFAAGLLLSLVLAPCATPVLASVLSFAAYRQSVAYGATLLFVYGLGVGLPVLVFGAAAAGAARRFDALGWRAWVDRIAGGALLAIGLYLLWRA